MNSQYAQEHREKHCTVSMNCLYCKNYQPRPSGITGVCRLTEAIRMCNDNCDGFSALDGEEPSGSIQFAVRVPNPPNSLVLANGEIVPLCTISPSGLRRLGDAITDRMITLAQEQQTIYYTTNGKP